MPNQVTSPAGQVNDPVNTTPAPGANPDAGKQSSLTDAEAALLKENMAFKAKIKAFEDAEAKRQAEAAKAAEEAAKKNGEFERLFNERDTEAKNLKARVEAYDKATQARIDKALESIPEASRPSIKAAIDAIPDLDKRESALSAMLAAIPAHTGTGIPTPKPGVHSGMSVDEILKSPATTHDKLRMMAMNSAAQ